MPSRLIPLFLSIDTFVTILEEFPSLTKYLAGEYVGI